MHKEILTTSEAPAAIGPYSQAVKIGEMVFVYGQIAIDPVSGEVAKGDIRSQTRLALKNVEAVLSAAGTSLDKVVKTTVFITSMDDFAVMNKVYAEFFSSSPPARACVEVSKLPKNVNVEVEAVAVC